MRGARDVAQIFVGRARAAQVALLDGDPGLVWAVRGTPRALFEFVIENDRIVGIDLITDERRLAATEVRIPKRGRTRPHR